MVKLNDTQLTYLRIYGIPIKAINVINNYLPDDNEDFGKNFGSSSPVSQEQPIYYFDKIFKIMAEDFNIKLDIISHLCGDAYVVNPKTKFKLKKIKNTQENKFVYTNNFITEAGYGKYTEKYKSNRVKGDLKWTWILTK